MAAPWSPVAGGTEHVGLLVVGYGNELRGDDGAGRAVADRIDELGLQGVTVRSIIQLVPELAVDLAAADRAVFVDADVAVSSLVFRRIEPGDAEPGDAMADPDGFGRPGATTHHTTPVSLLRLAATAGARVPPLVEQLSLPATEFELGAPMSAVTAAAVDQAVGLIVERVAPGQKRKDPRGDSGHPDWVSG